MDLIFTITLVFHIIGITIAIGSATLTDYLHLIALRKSSLEKGIVKLYPYISKLINYSLILIYTSGIILVMLKPELLQSPLFIIKFLLVLLVTINGIYLQKIITPQLERCVIKGNKYCTSNVLYGSVIGGSISIVTWYSILILALTKTLGYTLTQFLTAYVIVLILAIISAYILEKRARTWRE